MKHRKLFHLDRLGLFHKHYTSLLLTGSNTLAYSSTVSVTNKKGLTRLTRVLLWGGKTERKKKHIPLPKFLNDSFFEILSSIKQCHASTPVIFKAKFCQYFKSQEASFALEILPSFSWQKCH
jgi:hypothetical protein